MTGTNALWAFIWVINLSLSSTEFRSAGRPPPERTISTFWAGSIRYLTNCQATSFFCDPDQIDWPLIVSEVPRLPAGPIGVTPTFHLNRSPMAFGPGENWFP